MHLSKQSSRMFLHESLETSSASIGIWNVTVDVHQSEEVK